MLTFLTGLDPAVKRNYIARRISAFIDEGRRVFLIVPEQSSFDRDREFLFRYGELKSNKLRVTSFTHFSADILEENGRAVKPQSDDAARAVLMSLAVRENADSLDIYRRFAGRSESVSRLIAVYDEIKQAGLTCEQLYAAGERAGGMLQNKTRELSVIFSGFEALLTARFSDPADNLNSACSVLKENDICSGAIFFFDGFRGFTGAQLEFMSLLTAQCGESFVSVTAPSLSRANNGEAFAHALRNAENIRKRAMSLGVRIFESSTDVPGSASLPLGTLRTSLFGTESIPFPEKTDCVKTVFAADPYEECELAALEIKRLLLQGFRCREVAVFERGGTYAPTLVPTLKKYGIPVFEDKRRPLYEYPLIRLVLSAVDIAANGFDTEKLLSCLKTGLCGIEPDEISALESYVCCWGINYGAWERDFTGNPDGFGSPLTDDALERLVRLNDIRKRTVKPLSALSEQLKKENSENDCRSVFMYLKSVNAAESFLEYARFLYAGGDESRAVECGRVWDECMSALDSLNAALNGASVSPREFASLLQLMLCAGTLGDIPAGIDEIVIGSADRMRFLSPRAVIVLGANEGVFPCPASSDGIFSARETRALALGGFALESLPENEYAEERLIAFDALACACERLTVMYSGASATGEKLTESEIVREMSRIFPENKIYTAADYDIKERLCTPAAAFENYAKIAAENTVFSASLREALIENGKFAGSVAALDRAVSGAPAGFESAANARELFGSELRFSASQVENYGKCPFMYFCRYGLGVNRALIARLDQRINGLLVHKVLEEIFKKFTKDEISAMPAEELEKNIRALTAEYADEYMGGAEKLTPAVKRDLERSADSIKEILGRFISEFGACSFVTIAAELQIGGRDVPAYTLTLPGGGSVTVTGSIDRVDGFDSGEAKYVRIIDYKTGGKSFSLSDVFDGLNMQMLIYLFALCQNGRGAFGGMLPAGILYVPAKNGGETLGRGADDAAIEKQRLKNGRMNGLLLEDEKILNAMEDGIKGVYIDASVNAKGELKGAFLSLKEFELLHRRIDEILIKTGSDILGGRISASPSDMAGKKDICEHCDYAAVCLHERNGDYRRMLGLKHPEARKLLNEEAENNG